MLKYILMILGGVIFIAGYYFMQQNEGRGKTMMFYSLFTYAGLTLVILSGARVLDPFFEGLGKNGEMIQLAVEVACFVIGAELLLKLHSKTRKRSEQRRILHHVDPEIHSVRRQIRKKAQRRRRKIIIRLKEVTVQGIKSIVKNKTCISKSYFLCTAFNSQIIYLQPSCRTS